MRGSHIFQKSRTHLKILGDRFRSKGPKLLGVKTTKFSHPGFCTPLFNEEIRVHPFLNAY